MLFWTSDSPPGNFPRRTGGSPSRGRGPGQSWAPREISLAALIQANVTYYSDAYRNAAHRMHGGELGEDIDNIGELVARVSKIGEPMLKDFIAAIVRNKGPMRVLDVGLWVRSPFEEHSRREPRCEGYWSGH